MPNNKSKFPVEGFIRPVIRLCIRYAIELNYIIELIKKLYVEEAKKILATSSKKTSITKISLLTGVHRKDTKRILEDENLKKDIDTLKLDISVNLKIKKM